MKLIDEDANKEYLLDGRYVVKPVKRGGWIKMSDTYGDYYACSECGKELFRKWVFNREFDILPHLRSVDKTPYCPWCGAKMEPISASPENGQEVEA